MNRGGREKPEPQFTRHGEDYMDFTDFIRHQYHNLPVSSRGANIFSRRKYSDVRRSVTPGRGHPGDSSTGGYVFGCGHAALGNLWLGMGSGLLDGLEWHG